MRLSSLKVMLVDLRLRVVDKVAGEKAREEIEDSRMLIAKETITMMKGLDALKTVETFNL
jgi:hypothetical protein